MGEPPPPYIVVNNRRTTHSCQRRALILGIIIISLIILIIVVVSIGLIIAPSFNGTQENTICPGCPPLPSCPICPPPPICSYSAPTNMAGNFIEFFGQNLDICPYDYAYVASLQRCYKISREDVDSSMASKLCHLDDAELVSINSLGENQAIGSLFPLSSGDRKYWIRLVKWVNNGGKWAWFDGTDVHYDNWADGNPDNDTNCSVIHLSTLQWSIEDCKMSLPYICEVKPFNHSCSPCPTQKPCPKCPTYFPCPKPKCDEGWKYYSYTYSCYFVGFIGYVNNSVAEDWCNARDAHLSSISSYAENSFILAIIYASRMQSSAWIGFYGTSGNATSFKTIDGQTLPYKNWAPNQPSGMSRVWNRTCTTMVISTPGVQDGTWDDEDCNLWKTLFVCKKRAFLF